MNRIICLVLLIVLASCMGTFAQDKAMPRRTRELYDNAQIAWKERKMEAALPLFQKLAELEPGLPEVHLRLGQLYEWQRQTARARYHYQQLVKLDPDAPEVATAYQWLGRDTFQRECYDSAQVYLSQALARYPERSNLALVTRKWIASAQFAEQAIRHPLKINKRSLGDTVNFLKAQFFPVLTADNETLIFTGLTPERDENMYITHRTEKGWDTPEEISKNINSPNNEGTCTISADGRTLVFTACNRPDGYGGCDLYFTRQDGKDWLAPKNMGQTVNSSNWESQPSLSADGSVLYFTSDRPGGAGKSDIWKTILDSSGEWLTPTNLGRTINTPDEENAPFIHANGHTLFYASNGLPGLGGFDLFMSQRTDTLWSDPKNLGYPINTVADQVGMYISADGQTAYYTDDRTEPKGRRAMLYAFTIPDTLQKAFVPTKYIKGKVFDQSTKAPLQALLELYDLGSQQRVATFSSQPANGEFLAVLNQNSEHALYVVKEGYLFKSLTFVATDSTPSLRLDIPLERAEKDRVEVLNNIFFATGEYTLDEKSKVELQKLVLFLKDNPKLSIEIAGHTDDVGSDKENLELSRQRAQSVVRYLAGSGLPDSRFTAIGYGETKPKVPNDSDQNRRLNRRIEWRIR
ncbi:OmpA family protein [Salmonirosea aquatica]|uniref:OmpA family protein n=1 Tax=Salmonirosea aquatica TaxID=2654236 RepID=A0A7C9F8E4_9BACT|nr:OmpA family protein [Cytophagaceae bacterium SJW1-29]